MFGRDLKRLHVEIHVKLSADTSIINMKFYCDNDLITFKLCVNDQLKKIEGSMENAPTGVDK